MSAVQMKLEELVKHKCQSRAKKRGCGKKNYCLGCEFYPNHAEKEEIKREKTLEHDEIINRIEKRLRKIGCYTHKKIHFTTSKGEGECDLYGIEKYSKDKHEFRRKKIYIIEIKRTDTGRNYRKAKYQLEKDELFLKEKGYDLTKYDLVTMYAFRNTKRERGYNVVRVDPYSHVKIYC